MRDRFMRVLEFLNKLKFLEIRDEVIKNQNYKAKETELKHLMEMLNNSEYEAIAKYETLNTVLCSESRLIKSIAYAELDDMKNFIQERIMRYLIFENIRLTGTGSISKPYKALFSSDIDDFILHIESKIISKERHEANNRILLKVITPKAPLFFDLN